MSSRTAPARPENRDTAGHRRAYVASGLAALAMVWILWLMYQEEGAATALFRGFRPSASPLPLALGLVSGLLTARAFHLILGSYSEVPLRYRDVAYLMFVSQLARHLPGRIWGVVVQLADPRNPLSPAATVCANWDFLLLSTALGLIVPIFILLLAAKHTLAALAAAVFGLIGIWAVLRGNWAGRVMLTIARLGPAHIRTVLAGQLERPHIDQAGLAGSSAHMLLGWMLYVLIWHLFPTMIPALEGLDMVRLCAYYTLAWAAGYITVLTPGGVGVREAAFVLIAGSTASDGLLAALAIIVRIWLLSIETILFLMLLPMRWLRIP